MKKLLFGLLLVSNCVFGQDIHFSQLSINNLVSNPAAAGFYSGWERLAVNHKNQWINANTNFLTTSVAADMNLFRPNSSKGAYLGVGVLFYNDIGGDSKFGLRHFSASISGIVPLNRNNRVSFGISSGFSQKSANLGGLLFPNQFDGQNLNGEIPSMETNDLTSNLYGDFSFGFLYQYGAIKKSISANRKMNLTLGVAYHHFNTPKVNFNDVYIENLYGKLSLGGEFIKDFSGSDLGIESYVNHFRQGPYREFFVGSFLRYQMSAGSKVTRLRKQVILSFGLGHRYKDALVPMIKFQKGSWKVGLSYDITVSELGSYKRTGGLEFSLVYNSQRFAFIGRRR